MASSGEALKLGEISETAKPDVRAIMAAIKERTKADVEKRRDSGAPFKTFQADTNARAVRKAGELQASRDLLYLNQNFDHALKLDLSVITSHRPGIIGRIIVNTKRRILSLLWAPLLRNFFFPARDFNSALVRFLNDLSHYVDNRDASNFWELIRKIDYDVTKALERIERIADEQSATLRSSEKELTDRLNSSLKEINDRISALQAQSAKHSDSLSTLNSVTSGLERIVAALSPRSTNPADESAAQSSAASAPDYRYILLENRFRGSEEEIKRRLSIYPPYFKTAGAPVLEIGAGRGELQQLFFEHGIPSYGVDLDSGMVARAREKGLDVRLEDGLRHLDGLSDRSLGGAIAVQVVEHLNREQLKRLFTLCAKKVRIGGRVIFETINPRSISALSSNYFRDPTHVFPLHPDTLSFEMNLCGLETEEIRFLSPFPEESKLRQVPLEPFMTPRWIETVSLFNRNIKQLNELLYGHQDFCVVARVVSKEV